MAKRRPKTPPTLEEIDAEIEQLRAQRADKVRELREEDKRKDTLRRTLLGGALIARAREGDTPAITFLHELQRAMTGADAEPFEGWRFDQKTG